MGTIRQANRQKVAESHNIADALFTATQQRVLALLFGQPERSFYARELITLTGSGSGAVQRELARLTQSGLLTLTAIGNQKHYQANAAAPVFSELRSLVTKTFGITDRIRFALHAFASEISLAFVYGSIAKNTSHAGSDIDVIIVSDSLTLSDVLNVVHPLEVQLQRTISPLLYTDEEFSRRRRTKNPFITKVLAGSIIPLFGDVNANH